MRSIEERFWSKVDKRGPDECWEWTGATTSWGYGALRIGAKQEGAHRVSFMLAHGRWATPCTLHHCDNPKCVNPSHLYEGTQSQNMRDRDSRGRHYSRTSPWRVPHGIRHWNAKLCDATVAMIRMLDAMGSRQCDLAEWFGVCDGTISSVRKGKAWRHAQH